MKRLELDSNVNIDEIYGRTFDEDDVDDKGDEMLRPNSNRSQSEHTDLARITWEQELLMQIGQLDEIAQKFEKDKKKLYQKEKEALISLISSMKN